MGQRMGKLEPPARDPGVILTAHFKRHAIWQQIACFFYALAIGENLAGQDKCLGPGAAFREAKRHQQ